MSRFAVIFLIVCVVPFVGYVLALNYRYEPVAGSGSAPGTISVWDRWNNRVCLASYALGGKPICSAEELRAQQLRAQQQ